MDPLRKAIKILEPLDKKYPDHPGIAHYLIHSYDFAPIARKGVPAANKYAKIAPSAPHAQHMPSHIYSMVGMWDESIQSNERAVEVSREIGAQNWPRSDKKYPDHPGIAHYLIHSYDFAPIARKGVPAANKYAKIAPSAPHAQHMPSHIYSMVGMWDESIQSNERAVEVSREIGAQNWP